MGIPQHFEHIRINFWRAKLKTKRKIKRLFPPLRQEKRTEMKHFPSVVHGIHTHLQETHITLGTGRCRTSIPFCKTLWVAPTKAILPFLKAAFSAFKMECFW